MGVLIGVLRSPLAHSIFVGWLGAAGTDLQVLVSTGRVRGWAAFRDFDWNTASFRWIVGAFLGLLIGLGFNVGGLL